MEPMDRNSKKWSLGRGQEGRPSPGDYRVLIRHSASQKVHHITSQVFRDEELRHVTQQELLSIPLPITPQTC